MTIKFQLSAGEKEKEKLANESEWMKPAKSFRFRKFPGWTIRWILNYKKKSRKNKKNLVLFFGTKLFTIRRYFSWIPWLCCQPVSLDFIFWFLWFQLFGSSAAFCSPSAPTTFSSDLSQQNEWRISNEGWFHRMRISNIYNENFFALQILNFLEKFCLEAQTLISKWKKSFSLKQNKMKWKKREWEFV